MKTKRITVKQSENELNLNGTNMQTGKQIKQQTFPKQFE